ncbi:MAG TPA: RrF2 family transcriptional regulator [Clostridiales bacterium]|nr:RrF2 family transcriptional regulator [Clostridiales bacterium]
MLVSTRGRYALRVMIDLAEHQGEGYIPLKEIAERQEISEKYLENILKILVRNKVLIGLRGKGGGYRLAKSPDLYTVGSILRMTEGSLAPVACLAEDAERCSRMASCPTLPMWTKLDKMITEFFDSITIADLMSSSLPGDNYVI